MVFICPLFSVFGPDRPSGQAYFLFVGDDRPSGLKGPQTYDFQSSQASLALLGPVHWAWVLGHWAGGPKAQRPSGHSAEGRRATPQSSWPIQPTIRLLRKLMLVFIRPACLGFFYSVSKHMPGLVQYLPLWGQIWTNPCCRTYSNCPQRGNWSMERVSDDPFFALKGKKGSTERPSDVSKSRKAL